MQQRQPRLGDVLDDYCPRERRLTNHAVVAMIGDAVKQTRCTTCESEHEYKQARLPRPRRKSDESALYSQVLANVSPKKITPPPAPIDEPIPVPDVAVVMSRPAAAEPSMTAASAFDELFEPPPDDQRTDDDAPVEEGPSHRPLIRAQLPRHEGQISTMRQAPDFTIRQPAPPRGNRFRQRPQPQQRAGGGAPFQGNRNGSGNTSNGNSNRGGAPRPNGRPTGGAQRSNRHGSGQGRNRPK
jgi:hypothetical protein